MTKANTEVTKSNQLSRIHTDFLFELAQELNGDSIGSYRNYEGHNRDELIQLISGKLSSAETREVVSEYLMCKSPGVVADKIRPGTIEEIQAAAENFFDEDALAEVKIGRRTCDLVFPEKLTAVEIKSARDKLETASDQLKHHSNWAELVYLAFDQKHESNIPAEITESTAGLLKFEDGNVEQIKEPTELNHSTSDFLSQMVYDHVERIARNRGLEAGGSKEELVERLTSELSQNEARRLFMTYLATRT